MVTHLFKETIKMAQINTCSCQFTYQLDRIFSMTHYIQSATSELIFEKLDMSAHDCIAVTCKGCIGAVWNTAMYNVHR